MGFYYFVRLFAIFMLYALVSCSDHPPTSEGTKTLEELIEAGKDSKKVDAIISYSLATDATRDIEQLQKNGAKVDPVGESSKTYRVQGAVAEVGSTIISNSASAIPNRRVSLVNVERNGSQSGYNLEASDYMMVRDAVGVTRLLDSNPTADGRGVKVAVFDTGIDFGVRGLSDFNIDKTKYVGFYDFSGFGTVETREWYASTDKLEFIDRGDEVEKVSFGILSEKQIARDYFIPYRFSLDGNEDSDNVYRFILGRTKDSELVLWVDWDGDGWVDIEHDMLRDFNSSHQYRSLVRSDDKQGIRNIAVTIHSKDKVQFHAVTEGHGTACALIIAGDGFGDGSLLGMAPKAEVLSYVLDATGQDIYTMQELIEMFLHAKSMNVDAISISWGFSTADLKSARFLADFLDSEITSAGIVVGIAAGNEGPGLASGSAVDYIPHNGLAVGALINSSQANNVYGWTGLDNDGVVYYSSFGPSVGGRQIPDVVSPIISLVRGHKESTKSPFYGFSGTSSATPALIGGVAALISLLKQEGIAVDTRVLKLAIQNSSQMLSHELAIRQGAGAIDVHAAYDLYKKLVGRNVEKAGKQGQTPQHDVSLLSLKAQVKSRSNIEDLEGIHLTMPESESEVSLVLNDESFSKIDENHFIELVELHHEGSFFTIPSSVAIQSKGARFTVKYNTDQLLKPGVYSDQIKVVRQLDKTCLLTIPVVLEIAAKESAEGLLAEVDTTLRALDVWRLPVQVDRQTSIKFEAMLLSTGGFKGSYLNIHLRGPEGHYAGSTRVKVDEKAKHVEFETKPLKEGRYELLLSRNFSRPAVVSDLKVFGTFKAQDVSVVAKEVDLEQGRARFVLNSYREIRFDQVAMRINGRVDDVKLVKGEFAGKPGFVGELELNHPVSSLYVGLQQDSMDRYLAKMLHMSLLVQSSESFDPLYRGWIDVTQKNFDLNKLVFPRNVKHQTFKFLAYPNVVNWNELASNSVDLRVWSKVDQIFSELKAFERTQMLSSKQPFVIEFDFEPHAGLEHAYTGYLELSHSKTRAQDRSKIKIYF